MDAISQPVCKERKSDGGDSKCHQKLKLESKALRVARKGFRSSDGENCRCRSGYAEMEEGEKKMAHPQNLSHETSVKIAPIVGVSFAKGTNEGYKRGFSGERVEKIKVESVRSEGDEKSVATSKYNCKYKLATAACTLRSTN